MGGVSSQNMIVGTEDCLYLDIKAPKNKNNEELPVMFWIHGGGNTSGLKDLYDFSGLVKKHDVIVVSINYRLGLLVGLPIQQSKIFKQELIRLLILELLI